MEIASKVVHDKKSIDPDQIVQCRISVHGSWKQLGMLSSVGHVMVLSTDTGQVLDRSVLTYSCRKYAKWADGDKDSVEYQTIVADQYPKHPIKHKGSASSMECAGAVQMCE